MRVGILGVTGVAGRAFLPLAEKAGLQLRTDRVDILDAPRLVEWTEGCDAIVNLATAIRTGWDENDRIRTVGTRNLLAASERTGARIIVQQSVAMLHRSPNDEEQSEDDALQGTGVLASAMEMEALIRTSPLDVRIARGALFYGPGTGMFERWLDEVKRPDFKIPGDGNQWMTFVHVDDFAGGVLTILLRGLPRNSYIVSDDSPLRAREVYALAAKAAGVPVPACSGTGNPLSFRVSNAKLKRLGWSPRYPRLRSIG